MVSVHLVCNLFFKCTFYKLVAVLEIVCQLQRHCHYLPCVVQLFSYAIIFSILNCLIWE